MCGLQKLLATMAASGSTTGDALISHLDWSSFKLAEVYEKANCVRLGVRSSRIVSGIT
jgi:hypothetical protein